MIATPPNRAGLALQRFLIAGFVSVALLTLAPGSSAFAAGSRGTMAGKVFEKSSEAPLPNVTVAAYALTTGEEFQTVTDATGGFYVGGAPTSVYSFSLRVEGIEYVVQERLDVRVGMPFLLESCFELDVTDQSAHVRERCDSGLVEPTRVATIGPHRFLTPQDSQVDPELRELKGQPQQPAPPAETPTDAENPDQSPSVPTEQSSGTTGGTDPTAEDSDLPFDSGLATPDAIVHDELECLTYDHFPIVDANIEPGEMIEISRVYFRSDKYPDFYYVDMGPEHPTVDDFRAILPKPSRETERIYYYVESVDSNFDTLQTPEFDPEVLEVQACKERGGAWFLGEDPEIIVGATTAGAAALPPGFQAVGITGFVSSLGVLTTVGGAAAAGGGVASTSGLVLVVAGGTAAAAGTTVAVTGDEEASPP